MDARTRVKNAIEHKPMDRIPRYDALWEDALTAWVGQGFPKGACPGDYFDWDIVMMAIDVSMRQAQKLLDIDEEYKTIQDRYGYTVRKAIGRSRSIEFSHHVTRDRDTWEAVKARFRFDPNDTSRLDETSYFLHMAEYPTWAQVRSAYDRLRQEQKYLVFNAYGPWEGTWRHRGYSELLMDIALKPEWVQEMAGTLVNLLMDVMTHCVALDMRPDALFLVDDLACNKGLLFSPDAWRKLFKPLYRKLGEFLHRNEISFWLHCCGDCRLLLDDLVECGVDVLQPLQATAGMDVRDLKRKYGDQLTFWGNIDVHKMSGPADILEAEIRDKITVAKQGGGYMYHSDHSVPPEVSFERYKWIMELVDKYGAYSS